MLSKGFLPLTRASVGQDRKEGNKEPVVDCSFPIIIKRKKEERKFSVVVLGKIAEKEDLMGKLV